VSSYGAASAPLPPLDNAPIDDYAIDDYATTGDYDYETPIPPLAPVAPVAPLGQYSSNGGANGVTNGGAFGDDALAGISDSNLAMLEKAVPGVPGQDYPIYASVPETPFTCDGQVEGGEYLN
jgi:hypothetical protein